MECDEHQHKDRSCSCEQTRMVNIGQGYGGLAVYFIRWNPDDYTPFNNKLPEVMNKRYKLLGDLIDSILKKRIETPVALLSVLYMYYDEWDSLANDEWKVITGFELK